MVNTPVHVGTAAYSYKIRVVRAGMRLSIAIEHPGNQLLTVTEFFPGILRFSAEKNGENVIPCAFSRIAHGI